MTNEESSDSRWCLDLAGYWNGRLTLNPGIDVAAPPVVEREFYLPLPWNVQLEDLRWPGSGQELSGIVRPIQNQNFRDVQRKFFEGTMVLRRRIGCHPPEGQRAFLVFEGSQYRTAVKLNGKKLGTHDGGHLAFEFEATGILRDGENDLEIVVDNLRRRDAAPQEQFNWQNYGGVYRPFRLETRPAHFIWAVRVTPGRDRNGWFADLAVELDARAEGRIRAKVQSGRAEEVAEGRMDGVMWRKRLRMRGRPVIWKPGMGGMSACTVSFTPRDGLRDEVRESFGFRTVEVKQGKIRINGRSVRILGAALHEQHPVFGNAVPGWQSEYDLRLMKYCGLNTVRAAHYPHAKTFYEACDREGMLCLAELPCWQFHEYHFHSPSVQRLCCDMAGEMVKQLGNHPSIIGWIVQNESKTFQPGARKFFSNIAGVFKKGDPSRFTLSAESVIPPEHLTVVKQVKGTPKEPPPPTADCVDILGVNNYAGWYAEKSDYLPMTLDHLHRKLPRKPLLVTEFGGEGISGERSLVMAPWTEDYQAELISRHVREILARPFMAGFVLWLFADYECASIGIRAINAKGLVDEFRRPKLSFNRVKQELAQW